MMRTIVLITLALTTLNCYSQAERKFVRKGNSNYKQGRFQQAEVEYRKALEKDPGSYKADFNLGNSLYKQKQYDAAAGRYTTLIEKKGENKDKGRYYYNLGNSMYETQKYGESVNAYKNALRADPGDMDAKHNLQLALKMLKEQQQQQQQNKNGQNKNNNKDQNNKQNQDQQKDNQQKDNQQKDKQNNQDQDREQQNGQQPQPQKGQISPEDAERILQALENEEKEVMKKAQEKKEQVHKVPLDKNW